MSYVTARKELNFHTFGFMPRKKKDMEHSHGRHAAADEGM